MRANAILAIGEHPHRTQPLVEADSGILENGSDLDAKLGFRVTRLALPYAALWHKRNLVRSAVRASHAFWPAALNQIVDAVVRIREVNNRALERLGFGFVSHAKEYTG